MTYTARIIDSGVSISREIEAADLEAACLQMEEEMLEAEQITAGNPDCEPRTDWSAIIIGDDAAECTLRAPDQHDAAAWAKCYIIEGAL